MITTNPTAKKPESETSTVNNATSGQIPLSGRIASIDVYRGFVMILMMAQIIASKELAEAFPDNIFWRFLAFNQNHVLWTGASLHDMIQPSFTFLVGVVLPVSVAIRKSRGDTFRQMLTHTVTRSFILIGLGIFLRSIYSTQTNFTFEDTLTQIGMGYVFLFLLAFCSRKIQLLSLIGILVGYWLFFVLYPLPGADFDYSSAGVSQDWAYNLHGFAAHWNKNTNAAWAFDTWFLNLFPRETPFLFNKGGYATLSFIPTLGTMILGLFAGEILRAHATDAEKIKKLVYTGAGLIAISILLHFTGTNPIVKRIWTPAWTLFSGGICYLFLAFFYGIIDVWQKKRYAFLFTVVGVNSIAAYVIAESLVPFITESLYIHLGRNFDQVFGSDYALLVTGSLVLLAEWLILHRMYRKKIFIKI